MHFGNNCYLFESKEEFLKRYNKALNRYNYSQMPKDFDIEKATFPMAVRYYDSFDPHFCGSFLCIPVEEAKEEISKAYQESIQFFIEKQKELESIGR